MGAGVELAYSRPGAEATVSSIPRRRTSRGHAAAPENLRNQQNLHSAVTFGTTPFDEEEEYRAQMSLDRSPSPQRGGGWSSPGLISDRSATRSRGVSPSKRYGDLNGGSANVTWESAKANSARVNGQPSYQSQNQGFFGRSMKRITSGLPYWSHDDRFAEKEKLGRGRLPGRPTLKDFRELPRRIALIISRRRKYVALILLLILGIFLFNNKGELCHRPWAHAAHANWTCSNENMVPKKCRRREQIRHHSRSESRRRCNGVERAKRMGDRA